MDLAEFLLARIAEDEAVARAAQSRSAYGWSETAFTEAVELAQGEGAREPSLDHIARWDPARVLAECEAKRRIVEMAARFSATPDDCGTDLVLDDVLRLLALPYADHPDYREEWKP